uniref:UDP-glucuronosyltransferase 2B7 n=1 Tax=Ceratitis capitata TaxID=7213 RepID=W8BYX3_CERCA
MKSTNFLLFGLLVTLLQAFGSVKASNILSLIEIVPEDEQIWHDALIKGLTDRGHKVTVVSGSSTLNSKSPLFTKILLELVEPALLEWRDEHNHFTNKWLSPFGRVLHWYDKQIRICKGVLTSDGLLELVALARGTGLEEPFDVILYDATHGRSCILALAQLFEHVPIVGVSASHITPDLLKIVRGAQQQPATVPHFTSAHTEHMNFFERLHNTFVYAYANFYVKYTVTPVQQALLAQDEALQAAHVNPILDETSDRIKIVLVNDHPAINYVHSLPPNVIQVGGLQFDNVNRPLSVEMQTFIDNSRDGVIIITLGGEMLTQDLIDIVLRTIASFPEYGFIWGIKKNRIPAGERKNLYVEKWPKKSNILEQRKVKGVITGGSHMEMQEAVYNGVPIIAIKNAVHETSIATRVESFGIGLSVDLTSIPDNLKTAIRTLTSYQNCTLYVKARQSAFRNRLHDPLEVALWWIEFVIAYAHGTDYLYSTAVAESWFLTLHSLDVVAVVVIFSTIFIVNAFVVFKGLKLRSEESSKMDKSEKKSKSKKSNDSHKKRR